MDSSKRERNQNGDAVASVPSMEQEPKSDESYGMGNGDLSETYKDGKDIAVSDNIETEDTVSALDPNDGLPIDRGWAWVILFACFLEMFIVGGVLKSFGVFFLQFQKRFNSSAAETSLMSLIQNVVISVTALFVMTVGLQRFSSRISVFVGGSLHALSYLITAYTFDIGVFYFAFGVLGGLAFSFTMPPILAILGVYFKKHRGLANSIFASGGSVGGFIFSPIVIKLFDEYGFSGAMLIFSGIMANILVSAVLLRPLEFYSKRKQVRQNDNRGTRKEEEVPLNSQEMKESNTFEVESDLSPNNGFVVIQMKDKQDKGSLVQPKFIRMHSNNNRRAVTQGHHSPLLLRSRTASLDKNRQRTVSESAYSKVSDESIVSNKSKLSRALDVATRSQKALFASGDGLCGSFVNLNIPCQNELENSNEHRDTTPEKAPNPGCCTTVKASIISVICEIFDIRLLKKPIFILFLTMAFCFISGLALVPVFIPPRADDIGLSGPEIGMLLSIQSGFDLVAKVALGVVADRMWLRRSTILAGSAIVLGTACHLVRFVRDYYTMLALNIISGICCGQYLSIYAVLMMEVIGPVIFKKSLGFGTLIHGASIATSFPIGGMLRDVTGAYIATFHLVGTLAYIGAVVVLIIEWVHKRRQKTKN